MDAVSEYEPVIKVAFFVIFAKKSRPERKNRKIRRYRKSSVIGQMTFYKNSKNAENFDFTEDPEIGRGGIYDSSDDTLGKYFYIFVTQKK